MGKSVSRSTYYAHAVRRVQENVSELQAPVFSLREDEEDIDMTGNSPDMGQWSYH
jgi:hypothetical protein